MGWAERAHAHDQPTRFVIIGTAPSWTQTPWHDPSVTIAGLNDAYTLEDHWGNTFPRADEWFDLHPFDEMWFRPLHKREFHPGELPEGKYIRPEGHIEWLKARAMTMPVWLHDEPPADWPANAKRFPFEPVADFLTPHLLRVGHEKAWVQDRAYITSSPELMLAHAILRKVDEVQIFGIHLATEWEYRVQRGAMEWLFGRAQERGIKIVLPQASPLMRHPYIYGYEKQPVPADLKARKRVAAISGAITHVSNQLVPWPWWKRGRKAMLHELQRLRGKLRDANLELRHAQLIQSMKEE